MISNMAASLIMHKRITTTTAKAKALRTYVEPILTKSKVDSTHSRREVFSFLKDKKAVAELFREISPKIAERHGGYTRILKTGNRIGDNAEMCIMELVDYNEAMLGGGEGTKAKTTRRRKPTTKKKTEGAEKTADTVAEKTHEASAEAETPAENKAPKEEK
jgi:large subunit ribosomal protein L17